MDPNPICGYLIDDGELRYALESFYDMPPTNCVGYGDGCSVVDESSLRKRGSDEACKVPKSKAGREKIRRDRLNDRFAELSSILDPGGPPKSDKVGILSDAARFLVQLRTEAEQLKESNDKLQETIKELKVEKNELRDEKMRLKTDKERLAHQLKAISVHAPFPHALMPPHPMALHPPFTAHAQSTSKNSTPVSAYPVIPMWQWLPPAFLDTTHDAKLWSPHA